MTLFINGIKNFGLIDFDNLCSTDPIEITSAFNKCNFQEPDCFSTSQTIDIAHVKNDKNFRIVPPVQLQKKEFLGSSSILLKSIIKNSSGVQKNAYASFLRSDKWSEEYGVVIDDGILGSIILMKIDPIQGSKGYIYISNMRNDSSFYQGVGRALHEIAVRKSIDYGFEGRIRLVAVKGSSAFHFICGYRTDEVFNVPADSDKTIDDQIAEAIAIAKTKNKRADTSHLDSAMYLPDASIRIWRQRLAL